MKRAKAEKKLDEVTTELEELTGKKIKEKKVAELSEKLKAELLPPEPPPFHFDSVNQPKLKKIRPDFARVVETVFVNDLEETWTRLRKSIKLGEKLSSHISLRKALDNAEANAHLAHRLYLSAKLEFERWEKENEPVFAWYWSQANRTLQKEKLDGLRSKQITDADVKAYCATLFPEEYPQMEMMRREYKLAVDSYESLAELWKSRCRSLQSLNASRT